MSKRTEIVKILSERGVVRAHELGEMGISPEYLHVLEKQGVVQRVARGIYASAEYEPSEHLDLVIVQKRVPRGVFCLLTALQFHELTTQIPSAVHVAVERKGNVPSIDWPPIRVFQISRAQFDAGIEEHATEKGQTLRVYSPARTVADCFKFRSVVGLDVAIEALRDCLRQGKSTPAEIMKFARICRVASVMQPYVESMA